MPYRARLLTRPRWINFNSVSLTLAALGSVVLFLLLFDGVDFPSYSGFGFEKSAPVVTPPPPSPQPTPRATHVSLPVAAARVPQQAPVPAEAPRRLSAPVPSPSSRTESGEPPRSSSAPPTSAPPATPQPPAVESLSREVRALLRGVSTLLPQ